MFFNLLLKARTHESVPRKKMRIFWIKISIKNMCMTYDIGVNQIREIWVRFQ